MKNVGIVFRAHKNRFGYTKQSLMHAHIGFSFMETIDEHQSCTCSQNSVWNMVQNIKYGSKIIWTSNENSGEKVYKFQMIRFNSEKNAILNIKNQDIPSMYTKKEQHKFADDFLIQFWNNLNLRSSEINSRIMRVLLKMLNNWLA